MLPLYMEFAREKYILFDKWCSATGTNTFDYLCELVLLEEFKKCLPDRVIVYLNEQKTATFSRRLPWLMSVYQPTNLCLPALGTKGLLSLVAQMVKAL